MKHFDLSEFECPCCKKNDMQLGFLSMLDRTRQMAGIPFEVNSGFRCPKHNAEIGGKSNSSHLRGCAVDIKCMSNLDRFLVVKAAIINGFSRVGMGKTFIHLDNDDTLPQGVIWLY